MTAPQAEVTAPPSPSLLPADSHTAARMLALVKATADLAVARRDELTKDAEARGLFRKGDRITASNPVDPDRDLATVSVTKPKPAAKVTDTAAFEKWMLEHHDDLCRDEQSLTAPHDDVITALREYAPDSVVNQLVATRRVVPDWARDDVLRASKEAGQAVGPGGEIDEHAPPGVWVGTGPSRVQVRLADDALTQFRELGARPTELAEVLGLPAPAGPAD